MVPTLALYFSLKWSKNTFRISSRGSPVWERMGSTRLTALRVPLSRIFSMPMRRTSFILMASMS